MASAGFQNLKGEILKELKKESSIKIVLVGEAGVGKTWIAKEIREAAISGGICYASLWVSLNIKYDDRSLYESIAHQLSVFSATEEWEEYDNIEKDEMTLESLKQSISTKLKVHRPATQEENKCLLLILDDEGKKMNEEWVLSKLKPVIPEGDHNRLKIIISRRNNNGDKIIGDSADGIEVTPQIMTVESLPEDDALALLNCKVDNRFTEVQNFGQFSRSVTQKSCLPASIILIAEALNHSGKQDSVAWASEALEEAANGPTPLLRFASDVLPPRINNCFWHSIFFFSRYGAVHYNELISHWLIEGYLGQINHVEEAYVEGHQILMELINRSMLKIQEDNIIVMEGSLLSLVDHHPRGFVGTARVGVANVLEDDNWKGFGRITHVDGMIKTLQTGRKGEKISTLLIDGSRLSREVPQTFFEHKCELEVLALFNPILRFLPSSLSNMKNLLVLVVRGCNILEDISCIKELRALTVLEISDAYSLKTIPDNLFKELSGLQSLNLSAVGIKSLHSISYLHKLRWLILRQCSFLEELPKLRFFTDLEVLDLCGATSLKRLPDKNFAPLQKLQILDLSNTGIERLPIFQDHEKFPFLKNLKQLLLSCCRHLTRLPRLKPLSGLQILDLSGADKLKEFTDESFEKKDELKNLDLSGTSISELTFDNLNLRELKLRQCCKLEELPCTETLGELELLDLSNASSLVKIDDKSFEHLKLLRYINLSNTKVTHMPSFSNILNLRELLLRDCSCIEKLQIEGLIRLEVLDLSGCSSLTELQDVSFKEMSTLQTLNLSETKIKCLPPLCNPGNLCYLVLRNCTSLEKLFPLESLSKLEVLDLSGSRSLTEIKVECLEHLTKLKILDLSEVRLVGKLTMSHLSNLTNLIQLSLRGSLALEAEPNLEFLAKHENLDNLDFSGTDVISLSSLDKLSKLRKLLLRGCSLLEKLPSLKSLAHLQHLDLSGTGISKLPDDIADLTCLNHLDLPDFKLIQEVGWEKIKYLPKELNWDRCSRLEPEEILVGGKKHSILVNGTKFFQILRENPKLREKCLKKMFLSVRPMNPSNDSNDNSLLDELTNNIYLHLRHFSDYIEQGQALEIHGFDKFPSGLENFLEDVEYLSLVENKFMSCLSDLSIGNLKKLKGCWLEKCSELKTILCNETDGKLGEDLEILWVSNLPRFQSVCSEKANLNLNNLQHLEIDCCPMLENVFPLPSVLENLKTLQIKFCDKVKTVFKCNESSKCSLQNLQTLRLIALPELTSIGAKLPSLDSFYHRECPKLEDTKESLRSGTASE